MTSLDAIVMAMTQFALLVTIWPEMPLCPKAVGGWLKQIHCPTFFIL